MSSTSGNQATIIVVNDDPIQATARPLNPLSMFIRISSMSTPTNREYKES